MEREVRKVVGRREAKFCQTVKPLLGRKPRCQHSEVLVPQNKYVLRSESTSSERIGRCGERGEEICRKM